MATVVGAGTEKRRSIDWVRVVGGGAICLLGVFLVRQPVVAATALLQVVAQFWLATGVVEVLEALIFRRDRGIWRLISGLIAIAAGMLVLVQPVFAAVLTVMAVYVYAAGMAFVVGVVQVIAGMSFNRNWRLVLVGVLQVALAVLLFVYPQTGAILIVQIMALLTIAVGVVLIATGLVRSN